MTALAVMVKTPGLSPVKTRLAAGVGSHHAQELYHRCLDCLSETMAELQTQHIATPYWAVAESQAKFHVLWHAFPTLVQGGQGLGERMHSICKQLLPLHSHVVLVGADSPQLKPSLVATALAKLQGADIVIGPSADGGFYLIATRVAIPANIWNHVTYSQSDTLQQWVEQCRRVAPQWIIDTHSLPILVDMDGIENLPTLLATFTTDSTPAGQRLHDYLENVFLASGPEGL